MPYKEYEVKKVYFTIGEVAKILDVMPSLIRYYESEFKIETKRKRGDVRQYTEKDIKELKKAIMLANRGFTIKLVARMMKMNKDEMKDFFNQIIWEL